MNKDKISKMIDNSIKNNQLETDPSVSQQSQLFKVEQMEFGKPKKKEHIQKITTFGMEDSVNNMSIDRKSH